MSIHDIIEGLDGAIANYGAEFVHKMQSLLHRRTLPETNDDLKKYLGTLEREKNKMKLTETLQQHTPNATDGIIQKSYQDRTYFRKTPTQILAYSLSHTEFGTAQFPLSDRKFSGRGVNTNYYQKIDPYSSSTIMDVGANPFNLKIWTKKTTTGTYGIFCKRDVSAISNPGIEFWISGTTINIRIADGINTSTLTVSFANLNDGIWHSIIVNVPATGNLEIFIDKVSQGTTPRGSVGSVTNSRSAYFLARDNAGAIQDKFAGDWAWFSWSKGVLSQQQIDDFHDTGLLDYTQDEIITIPAMGNGQPLPNCREGTFFA
jgi:hypothetical protein